MYGLQAQKVYIWTKRSFHIVKLQVLSSPFHSWVKVLINVYTLRKNGVVGFSLVQYVHDIL